MSVIVDTNILIRALIQDHPIQGPLAKDLLNSDDVVVTAHVLCEVIWVLRRLYKFGQAELIEVLETVLAIKSAVLDRPTVEAGLGVLRAGGDFADGVIEFEGRMLGGDTFVTFDRRSAVIVEKQGRKSLLLAGE